MSHSSCCVSLLLVLCTIPLNLIHSKQSTCDILGVHPDDCDKYSASKPNTFFFCGGDKTKKLPFKYVNDDYCDCGGSNDDEPGTSACNRGKFWCNNAGFRGKFLYSSWVNDGICDCCDGSDEINNDRVQCENTCTQKAKEELQDIIQQKKKYMEAIKIKQSLLRIADSKMKEKVTQKQKIETEIQQKRIQLQEKEELKKIAEDKESAYKEEKNRKQEEERAREQEERKKECEAKGGENCDEIQAEDESNDDVAKEEDIETVSEEEETTSERLKRERRERRERRLERNKERKERRKLNREKQLKDQIETESDQIETEAEEEQHHEHTPDEEFPYPEQYRPHDEIQIETDSDQIETEREHFEHTPDEEFPYPEQYRPHEETDDGFDWSEFDDEEDEDLYAEYMEERETEKEKEEEEEEVDEVMNELSDNDEKRGIFGDIWNYIRYLFGADDDDKHEANIKVYNPYTKGASAARKEYNNVNRDIRNLETDLEEVNKVINADFGEKNIYASLLNECYTTRIEKYDYEFCPFKNAKQKDKGSSTDLGSYKGFEVNENKETVMSFEGGQKCWNGPKRSINVAFKCDTENKVAAVTEPSTCKYAMTFNTPLACRQEELDKFTDLIENQFKTEL